MTRIVRTVLWWLGRLVMWIVAAAVVWYVVGTAVMVGVMVYCSRGEDHLIGKSYRHG